LIFYFININIYNIYILMNIIIKFIKRIFPKEIPKPTGRWNIDYCNKKINSKVDLSNEDHCGPCGQYALIKTELNNKIK
jgi:hypothetical protein